MSQSLIADGGLHPRMTSEARTALVTGGSSGIGLELARLFAKDGYRVILAALDTPQLAAAQVELEGSTSAEILTLPVDLSEPCAVRELGQELATRGITVDTLVNCAGFGAYGYFAQTDLEEELAMLQVNVVALTQLTKLCLSRMLAVGNGRIVTFGER